MPDLESGPARERVLSAAMRLFGEQGYRGTTIAQIEHAAGLSPGSGALYRHFSSKRAILEAGIEAAIAAPAGLAGVLHDARELAALPLEQRMLVVARAGLQRLSGQRDLNRLVLRDLAQFEDLLETVRKQEIGRFFAAFTTWLRQQPEASSHAKDLDWEAIAMVLMGAVSHYWIMIDIFGVHPTDVDAERYLGAAARLAATAMQSSGGW